MADEGRAPHFTDRPNLGGVSGRSDIGRVSSCQVIGARGERAVPGDGPRDPPADCAVLRPKIDFTFGDDTLPSSALPAAVAIVAAMVLAGALMAVLACGTRRTSDGRGDSGRGDTKAARGRHAELVRACAAGRQGGGRASSRDPFVPVVWGVSLVLFVLQVLLIGMIYGFPGWDPGNIVSHAIYLVSGQDVATPHGMLTGDGIAEYYAIYPNNAFLTWVFMGLSRMALTLGVDPVFLCDAAGALSVSVGGAFAALFVRRVTGSSAVAYAGLGLYALLFSLSPWVSIPYSDTYASGFIGAELYLAVRLLMGPSCAGLAAGRVARSGAMPSFASTLLRSVGGWFALALVALVGYLIKPTVAIVLMATVVVWLVWLLCVDARPRLPRALGLVGGACVAAAFALGMLAPAAYYAVGIDANSGRAFGMSHFFMMGQNNEQIGGYLDTDVAFSGSILDPEERQRANLDEALARIEGRGVTGNLAFYAKKLLYSFGDGTFSWALDGRARFLTEMYPTDSSVAHAIRGLYYRSEWQADADQTAFRTVTQVLWYTLIVLWAVAGLAGVVHPRGLARLCPGQRGFPLAALVPIVSLLGMCLYLLLFEDRARYLYCFGPACIACASIGLAAGVRAWKGLFEGRQDAAEHADYRLMPEECRV